jgi:hypothetical protein
VLRLRHCGLLVPGLVTVAFAVVVGGCGADAARTGGQGGGGPPAAARTVRVTGQVPRSCSGPLLAGRPRPCSDRAVFELGGSRVVVRGRFSVRLRPGRYRVSVDTCVDQETLDVKRAIAGLQLVPRCPVPL